MKLIESVVRFIITECHGHTGTGAFQHIFHQVTCRKGHTVIRHKTRTFSLCAFIYDFSFCALHKMRKVNGAECNRNHTFHSNERMHTFYNHIQHAHNYISTLLSNFYDDNNTNQFISNTANIPKPYKK